MGKLFKSEGDGFSFKSLIEPMSNGKNVSDVLFKKIRLIHSSVIL